MSKVTRGLRFFFFHLFRNPAYLAVYAVTYFMSGFQQKVQFYSREELQQLIESGKSFIRMGDGEIYMINFGSIHYQKYHPAIRNAFLKIIKNYSKDAPYVLGLPRQLNKQNTWLRARGLLHCWLPAKVMYLIRFPKKVHYMDAHFFYYKSSFEEFLAPHLKDKHVIVVTRKATIDTLQKNPMFSFARSSFVESPALNSFDVYGDLKKQTDALLVDTRRKPVILVAIGPASKPFVYEYSLRGIQTIDMGIGIERAFTDNDLTDPYPEFRDLER